MKKLLLLISAIIFANIAFAQTTCTTIQEVRALPNGTEVHYTGTATTTFYGVGGILIEDETGYLYIKNSMLSEFGSSEVRTNMQITEIIGTFYSATEEDMSHINVTSRNIPKIKITNSDATFSLTDITVEELTSNPLKYECQPVRLSDIKVINNGYSYSIGNEEKSITLVAGWDVQIPTRGTFEGYYGNNGTLGFIIPSAKHVTATAYNTLSDIKNAYESSSPNALEIEEAMLVNHIRTNSDGSALIYAQQTDIYQTTVGIVLKIEDYNNLSNTINVGDSIKGIKGVYSAFTADDDNKVIGSTMTITTDNAKSIKTINKNNQLNFTQIDDLEYIIGWGLKNYEALLAVTPKGKIEKKDIDGKSKHTLQINDKYIIIEGVDCSKFEGENVAVVGTIDAGLINSGETSIILSSEKDILATAYTFNTIKEMIDAGQPLATGVTYTLSNNVIVTHVYSWKVDKLNVYGVFVQDETGGLYIQSQSKFDFVAGDLINGISGTYHTYEYAAPYLDLKSTTTLQKISSNNLNSINYEEVTMATLASNPDKYASQIVKITKVGHGTREVSNYGETEKQNYLYQDKDTMIYEIWNYTLYDLNNIIGVFDYGSYRSFSIIPLSQSHIEQYVESSIDNQTISNNIFIQNEMIFAKDAIKINLYDINGKILTSSNNDKICINNLNHGIYIVRAIYANGNISTSKIIK